MSESLISLFDDSVKRFNRRPAIQYFCTKSNKWVRKNWQELSESVLKLANALHQAKVEPGHRVAILSGTRPEWVIADLAIIRAAAIVVPIYHSSLTDQVSYILEDADVKVIFVENQQQLTKVRDVQAQGFSLNLVVILDRIASVLLSNECYFDDFIADQKGDFPRLDAKKDDVVSLVYTSGTTGEPKGAMITHDNMLYEAYVIDKLGILNENDVQLMFLPLAHIFARVLEFAWIKTGHLLAFAESVDKITENMIVIKPTFMAGVPRIYEKIRAKVIESLMSSGLKKLIAQFALNEADKQTQKIGGRGWQLFLAKKLVFEKIGATLHKKFGGRLRFFISGGAQLAPEVSTFFQLSGVILCEGYGLTETSAATCLNIPWALKQGTVGRPLPGTEICLSDEKEILVRGRGVFKGFWGKPEQTKEVLSDDGWFRTGDIGEIDEDGFVKIIDRKKDIIVTSQGKNVAPQRVENLIKSKNPVIAHVVVVGDKRPYLTALIALDKNNAVALAFPGNSGHHAKMAELAANAQVYQEVKNAVALANSALASFEQIKRFYIVDKEFEVGKQLTPTLKVKRKACVEEFKAEIKVLYA